MAWLSHLLYLDDLKVFAKNRYELESLIIESEDTVSFERRLSPPWQTEGSFSPYEPPSPSFLPPFFFRLITLQHYMHVYSADGLQTHMQLVARN